MFQQSILNYTMLNLIFDKWYIDGYLPNLTEESKKLGLKLEIIGLNKKWEGFFQRTLDYYDYLKKN